MLFMMAHLYVKELGCGKFLKVGVFKDETRIDIREWSEDSHIPSKKGCSLPLHVWKLLMLTTPNADAELDEVKKGQDVNHEFHLGNNIYLSIKSPYWVVDLRHRFKDSSGVLRYTRKGIRLKKNEWLALKECESVVESAVPELKDLIPCCL